MDTRSAVRSRRRSTRLTGHSPQDEGSKRTTHKKRDSDHGSSGNSISSASRESSCPHADPNLKNASSGHSAHPVTQDGKATMALAKDESNANALPLFPNLPSSMAKARATPTTTTASVTAPRNKSSDTPSEKPAKNHVSNKWVKTARGSIRLASDSPAETSKEDTNKELGQVEEGRNAPPATARRRSRRLTSMPPDVRDETVEAKPLRSRGLVAINTELAAGITAGPDKTDQSEPDLQDLSINVTTEHDRSTPSTHHDELPSHYGKIDRLDQETKPLKDISPIPELLADIERIISSSPLATGNLAEEGTKDAPSPTPTQAVTRRAPANRLTRSRTLRSSSRSIDNTARVGKSLDLERTDSESSQVDGAFDDSIHGPRRRKAQVGRDAATKSKPRGARGTKRRAQELSEPEGNAPSPGPRQRRKLAGSGGSKPEADLSTSNPIEAATSRDAFAADDPSNAATTLEISEFARRSGEPPNPVTLAQMISARPQRADTNSDADSTEARDGSRHPSPEWVSSDNSSTRGNHGFSPPGGPEGEEDTARCADCGRAPGGRYLVCARCLAAVYCGRYCQLWDWPLHRARCGASDGAVRAEVELQEAYLRDMWAAALKMLREEDLARGTVESLLLGEAVRHPPARPAFMGLGRHHGFTGTVVDPSRSVPRDPEGMGNARVRSIRLAQAAEGGDE